MSDWIKDLEKRMLSAEKEMRKQELERSKARKRNHEAWKRIEEQLDKIQGKERSTAFQALACFSLGEFLIGTSMYNEYVNELTDAERKLITGK